MYSVGASYAHVHVQQKRQKEKLKQKMEDGRAKNGSADKMAVDASKCDRNKVYPDAFVTPIKD